MQVPGPGAQPSGPFLNSRCGGETTNLPKPPAFQFYAKDWRSSPTVQRMYLAQRGLYFEMLVASWEQDIPGTLPANLKTISRLVNCEKRIVRDLFVKFPSIFHSFPDFLPVQCGNLDGFTTVFPRDYDGIIPNIGQTSPDLIVNRKLHEQWLEIRQRADRQSLAGIEGNKKRWHKSSVPDSVPDRSASASASAIKNTLPIPLTPGTAPAREGSSLEEVFIPWYGSEIIHIRKPKHRRMWTGAERNALAGSNSLEMVRFFERKGFWAEVVFAKGDEKN